MGDFDTVILYRYFAYSLKMGYKVIVDIQLRSYTCALCNDVVLFSKCNLHKYTLLNLGILPLRKVYNITVSKLPMIRH